VAHTRTHTRTHAHTHARTHGEFCGLPMERKAAGDNYREVTRAAAAKAARCETDV